MPDRPVRLGPLERELVPVGRIQIVGNMQRAVLWAVVNVQQPHQRDPGAQCQR